MAPSTRSADSAEARRPAFALSLLVATSGAFIAADAVPPPSHPLVSLRHVRVRLTANAARVRVRSDEPLIISGTSEALPPFATGSWHILTPDAYGIHCGGRMIVAERVSLHAAGDAPVTMAIDVGDGWSPGRRYPGRLHLLRAEDRTLTVINEVDVEPYVASVVAHEVWPTFERAAFRAQAIAARTYVLYAMSQRLSAPFDVTATQGSQVYRGLRGDDIGRRAAEAARHTRGIVVAWETEGNTRLFSAFYSAACGGMTQSAAHLGREHDIRPLSGGARCDFCRIAPGDTYRWGPVEIDKREVASLLRGRVRDARDLGAITGVAVVGRTPQGRPTKLAIAVTSGGTVELPAETFRLIVGGERMRSTDCSIRVTERHVILENGRGFGHGIGLCQWGAQGMARHGETAPQILRFYYPGARLARAY